VKDASSLESHSGRMREVRKSLAGGSSGRYSCDSEVWGRRKLGTWLRFASDFLLTNTRDSL